MDLLNDYGKAFIFGVMLAAPIGPMALFVIRTTLSSGVWSGISIGLGAAIGDAFYAMISFLGITSITSFLTSHKFYIQALGACFIISFSLHLFVNRNKIEGQLECGFEEKKIQKSLKLLGTSIFLAVSNPPTIAIFIAGSSMLSILPSSMLESCVLTSIVLISSFFWYFALAHLCFYIRKRASNAVVKQLNTISIVSLLLLSLWILVGVFAHPSLI